AAPVIGKQAPGFYRYKVGSFECTSVNDGALTYPISNEYVANVSKDQVIAAAEAAYFPQNMVVCPYNPQVINTGSKLVLIDTGWGPASIRRSARSCATWRRRGSTRKRSIP